MGEWMGQGAQDGEERRKGAEGNEEHTDAERKIGRLMLENFGRFLLSAGVEIVKGDPQVGGEEGARRLVELAGRDLRETCEQRGYYLMLWVWLFILSSSFRAGLFLVLRGAG